MSERDGAGNIGGDRDIYVGGQRELYQFLQQLPVKMERNVMRGALRAGARVIQLDAKDRAPVGPVSSSYAKAYKHYPGALRDSVRVSMGRDKAGRVSASVKAGGKLKNGADVFYAYWVEFTGAAPHPIITKAARGKLSHRGAVRRALFLGHRFVDQVDHPGFQPRPFMRPAFDAQAQNAVVAVAEYIKKRLAGPKIGLDTSNVEITTS